MMQKIHFFKRLSIRVIPIFGLLFCLSSQSLTAQSNDYTGKVLSDSGTAIVGATVKVKGTNKGTATGSDGSFSINAPSGATLAVSAVGYITMERKVSQNMDFRLAENQNSKALNEVVVVGYGSRARKDLTGAISSIGSKTIESVPVPTVESALQGRATGVQVTSNDGAPGGNINVLIRGVGSLASYGNGPLYVVDGYPLPGGINNINPSDIASIDVLKDASATSIYGIRAANGVVIVTTKKGRQGGGVEISLDGYLSFQTTPKQYDVLNAKQFATMSNEVQVREPNYTGFAPWHNPDSLTNIDWQDAIYRNGLTQNYSLAIRGGNDKVQSSTSIGYYNQKGIVQGSYFQRLTLGLNLNYTPTKWLKSITSAKYSYQNSNNPFGTGNLLALAQNIPTMDGGNKLTNEVKDAEGNYGFYNPINTYSSKYNNPLYSIQTNESSNITNYFLGNSALEVTIMDGLRIKTLAGINTTSYNGSYFQPEDARKVAQYGSAAGASSNAFYSQHIYNSFDWLWENTIAYDKTFGANAIHFVGGVSAQKTTNNFMGGSGIPPNSTVRSLSNVANLKMDDYNYNGGGGPGNGQTEIALSSQFARLSYGFQDKYLLTGTIRRDGSSKFDVANQYGTFGSGAIAWRAKQESFLQDVTWISDLKFRGSYGSVGNQGSIGLYQYQALYSTGLAAAVSPGNLGYPFDKIYQQGYAQVQPANPNLKWETDYQTDIGMDAAFLDGSLTVTVDWFNRKSQDFLLNLAAPAQTGYNNITRNVGTMQNKGLEFAANYRHTTSKGIQYNLGLTLTSIKNKLTSITSGTNFVQNFGGLSLVGSGWSTFTQTFIGQPVGEFYGFQSVGIFQSQKQIDDLNAASAAKDPLFPNYQQAVTKPGDRYFKDVNGDGHVDGTDQVSLGSPQPKFYGGFNVDVTYKAFDFNLFFYGVYGNKILNYVKNMNQTFENRNNGGVENVSQEYYANAWTTTNPSNEYARISSNDDLTGNAVPSSAWIENGSYLKLKNLTVGYTLPARLTDKAGISRIRLYLSTQNLFTITSYSGLDPEIGTQGGNATQNGIDNGVYPSSKFFTFGFNLTLK